MELYHYEAKKLLGNKICVIMLALLIALNFVFGLTAHRDTRDDNYSDHYAAEIDNIIYNAKMNYISIEDKDSEVAQYQLEIIKHYSELRTLDVSREVRGFDTLLPSPIPYVSVLLMGIIVAVMLVYREHSATLILSSFKHGRIKICISKLVLLFVTLLSGLLVFLVSQGLGVAIGSGFSGLSAPIQSIPAYIHCPYLFTVGEAALLRFLLALLIAIVVSLSVMLFGIVSRKSIWQLLFCVLLLAGDWLLSRVYSEDIFSIFYQLGIQNFITDKWLVRYSGKKVGGFFSQLELFAVFAFLVIALLTIISVWCFRRIKTIKTVKGGIGSNMGAKTNGKSLLRYEVKKIWSPKLVVAIILLFAASLAVLNTTLQTEDSDLEKIYRYYIEQMSELSYEEQVLFSGRTKTELSHTISEASKIREKFINGEETQENYVKAEQRAGAAELELDVLRVIDRQLTSIGELNEQGIQARLIYSSGWKKLMQNEDQAFLLFAVILLVFPYIAFEKESGLAALLPGVFHGDRKAYRKFRATKRLLAFAFSMMVVLLFYVGELLSVHLKYRLSDLTAHAAGADILFYAKELRIVEALLLRMFLSALGVMLIILLAEVLNLFFKRSLWTILSVIGIELFLYIVSHISGGRVFDLTAYFGFEMLYQPTWSIVIQTALLTAIPVCVLTVNAKTWKRN